VVNQVQVHQTAIQAQLWHQQDSVTKKLFSV